MVEKIESTYTVDIYMAGDIEQAKQVCRKYCYSVGFCVTVIPCSFIYTGGEETGFRVGCINYPRFPSEPDELWGRAYVLARMLRERLFQHSFSMVAPDRTLWSSARE